MPKNLRPLLAILSASDGEDAMGRPQIIASSYSELELAGC